MDRPEFTPTSFAEAEELLLIQTLDHFRWDKRKAAEVLGCSLKTIYNKLHKLGYSSEE